MKLPSAFFSVLMFLLLVYMSSGSSTVFTDPDTAWHLAAGDLIRTHGLSRHDSWSFTATDETWYNLSWLFDVGLSLLYSNGGLSALYTLTIAVFAGSLAFMAGYSVRRGASPVAAALILLPTLYILSVGVLARPNMCSIVLTIAFYCLLHRYRTSGRLRDMLILPLLMALWVNLHGGFLLAFLIIGLFLLEAIIMFPDAKCVPAAGGWVSSILQRCRNNSTARGYGIILAACMASTLLNPYGFGVYYGACKSLFAWFDHTFIMEWKPIEIGHNISFTLWFIIVLCVGSCTDRRIALVDRMLAVVLILLSLSSIRHSIISSLLLMPYLSLRLTLLLEKSFVADYIRSRELRIIAVMEQGRTRIAGCLLVIFSLVLIYMPWLRDAFHTDPLHFPANRYPVEEAAFIEQHYPRLRFLNHYDIGGYLIYLWRGRQKVFVDGRASSLYSDDLLRDYAEFIDSSGLSERSDAIVRYYRIDGLIMPNDARNAVNFQWNPAWKIAYRGPVATIYLKAGPAQTAPAARKHRAH